MHKEGDKRCQIKEFEDLRSFEEYSCGMCKFISRSFTDLKNHKKVELSGKNTEEVRNFEKYPCVYCDFISTSNVDLINHKKFEHPETNKEDNIYL